MSLALSAPALAEEAEGRWGGRMESPHLSAGIDLALHQSAGTWTAQLTLAAGAATSSLAVDELLVAGGDVQIVTTLEGARMTIDLRHEDGLLLGSVRAMEGERVLVEGSIGLARLEDAAGQERLTKWLAQQGLPVDAVQRQAVIDRAAALFLANYVFEDKARQAVSALRSRAAAGEYDSIATAAHLAEALSSTLAQATGDKHVRVKYSTETYPDPLADADAPPTPVELAQQWQDAAAQKFGIGQQCLLEGGRIGYLPFTRFFPAHLAGNALAFAMEDLACTEALIIDLRECRGGDPAMAVLAASWLFDGPARHWNDMQRRFDNTQRQYWTADWLPGPRFVDKSVYVLTAARTFSAPESLAYELQQTKRATIVGETTGGGAHPGAWFPIDGQFAIFIPLSRYVSAVSGGDWEGTGVVPDVPCPAGEALDRATSLALEKLGERNNSLP